MIRLNSRLWVIGGAFFAAIAIYPQVGIAQTCAIFVNSAVKLLPLAADKVIEHRVTPDELMHLAINSDDYPPTHALVLIAESLDIRVGLQHRIVSDAGKGFCDVPTSLLISLGIAQREVWIATEAAADPCIGAALLGHEVDHYRLLERAVRTFLRQHRQEVSRTLASVREKPAADPRTAAQMLEQHLLTILRRIVRQFRTENIRRTKQIADSSPRLATLLASCSGRLDKMEKAVRREENSIMRDSGEI
ncbi:MAG: hypothetical protein ACM3JG_08125 [Thiohalocapsa sp.]